MKRLIIVLLLLPCMALGQDVATTTEEYLYLTKGLKRHLEEGADPKNGYTLMDGQPSKNGAYEFTIRPFIKNETNQVVAVSVVAKGAWGSVYYLCIPRNNGDLFLQYQKDLQQFDGNMSKAYALLTSYMMAESLGIINQIKK